MDINQEVVQRIGQPESEQLEYKSVLPPAATVAQLICSFANANGGAIVLGVVENGKEILINGLSDEFRAVPITRKAIDLLSPTPTVNYGYITYQGKRLFVIDIKKSDAPVALGGRTYIRVDGLTTLRQAGLEKAIRNTDIARLSNILKQSRKSCTAARAQLLDHYESVLRILDDLGKLLYPQSPTIGALRRCSGAATRVLHWRCRSPATRPVVRRPAAGNGRWGISASGWLTPARRRSNDGDLLTKTLFVISSAE
jgi:hypothetical protein